MSNSVGSHLVLFLVIIGILTNFSGCVEKSLPTPDEAKLDGGLEKKSNQYEPFTKVYSYEGPQGSYGIPSGWKYITTANDVVSEAKFINADSKETGIFLYNQMVYVRLPFWDKPLSYETGIRYITQDRTVVVMNRFADWTDDFQYNDTRLKFVGIADGATARTDQNKVVATAKLRRLIQDELDGSLVGVEIEETHFDSRGKISFSSISQFELPSGFKRFERVLVGKKKVEYFPVWPVTD